jgi:hypothetical protein
LVGLERQQEHLAESFQSFSAKRLDAGVAANMERRQKGEQFRVLESAFPPPDPVAPNRLLILLVGVFVGLAVGVGAAILAEALSDSFDGSRETQRALGVPVLVSIPSVMLESDRAALRRRRVLAGVLAAGIAALTLVGAGAGYVAVNGAPGFIGALTADEAGGDAPELER